VFQKKLHKILTPQLFSRMLESCAVFSKMFRKKLFTRQTPAYEYGNYIFFVLLLASKVLENKIHSKIFNANS